MADLNLSNATTTDFTNTVPDFIVESMALDIANSDGEETYVYFDKAQENYGYQLKYPQIASRLNAICTWAFKQGYTSEDKQMEVILPKIDGNGKESFAQIIWNHGNIKLGHGDAFAEIVRNKNGTLVNIINISPERVKVVFQGMRLKRYEIWDGTKWVKKKIGEIFHMMNKKLGDAIRGN